MHRIVHLRFNYMVLIYNNMQFVKMETHEVLGLIKSILTLNNLRLIFSVIFIGQTCPDIYIYSYDMSDLALAFVYTKLNIQDAESKSATLPSG